MKKVAESHVDHGLTEEQLGYILGLFPERTAFFVETIELPESLGTVPCGLHGPAMDDAPIPSAEVIQARRGDRAYPSRLVRRPMRPTRKVTIVAGPLGTNDTTLVLYTAYGGPAAPQEPGELARLVMMADEAYEDTKRTWEIAGAPQSGPTYDALAGARKALDRLHERHVEVIAFWADHALTAPAEHWPEVGPQLPHDEGSAPPKGFTRYQVEIDVHDDIDPSELLERAQALAVDLIPDDDDGGPGQKLVDEIENRVSVQRMEG